MIWSNIVYVYIVIMDIVLLCQSVASHTPHSLTEFSLFVYSEEGELPEINT